MSRWVPNHFPVAMVAALALSTLFALGPVSAQQTADSMGTAPFDIVKTYLRATQARDWPTAYRYISSVDRGVRDQQTFVRSQETFDGFALDLAKRFTADMEIWAIEKKLGSTKARFEVGYRVPTGDEVSAQLLDWNPDKLNALSAAEQAAVVTAWEKVKQSGKAVVMEGRESFDLVKESDGWKIFLDWRSRHRVVFKTSKAKAADLAVEFLRNDFLVKNEEPFQIDFKITNRSTREIIVKLDHLFEPRRFEKNVDMIACGSRLPLRLRPQETQEISSAYVLRGAPARKSPLAIIYDFRLLSRGAPKP